MKIFIIVILSLSIYIGASANETDFRSSIWGMSIKEVNNVEKDLISTDDKNVFEKTDFLYNEEFKVIFTFKENILVKGRYELFFESDIFGSKFKLLENLYNLLNEKYGKNNIKNVDFDLFLKNRDKLLRKGFGSLECKWKSNTTEIALSDMDTGNYGYVAIDYTKINNSQKIIENDEQLSMTLGSKNRNGFRDSNWGMTNSEVKSIEKSTQILEYGDIISYESTLLGMPCEIIYFFDANKLKNGLYNINPDISSPSTIIRDFLSLKEKLITIYDSPYEDNSGNIKNYNSLSISEFYELIDENEFKCVWIDNNTKIILSLLHSTNSDFEIALFYMNLAHTKKIRKELKNKL